MVEMPACAYGLFGKLPARGDFVRAGLPGDYIAPWDDWLQSVVGGSQTKLGACWQPAWLEAPVWRFALAPGVCGEGGVLGLLLPSVDSVGRYFPLTLAAVWRSRAVAAPSNLTADWLDACEAAGCAALDSDLDPAGVRARMPAPPREGGGVPSAGSVWWTAGAPRVAATRFALSGLPDAAAFAGMLDASAAPLGGTSIPPYAMPS